MAVTRDGSSRRDLWVRGRVEPGAAAGSVAGRSSRACNELFDAGADHVELEVEVDNDRALGLYTSVGFSLVATDDYYELTL